jgi:hypothetical protein
MTAPKQWRNELMGAPMAWMEIQDQGGYKIRLVYRVVCFVSKDKKLLHREANRQLRILRNWVRTRNQVEHTLLFWRTKPTYETYALREECVFYMRFATSPPLPAEIASQLTWCEEGAIPQLLIK